MAMLSQGEARNGSFTQLKKEPHSPSASYHEGKQLPGVEAAGKGIYIYVTPYFYPLE